MYVICPTIPNNNNDDDDDNNNDNDNNNNGNGNNNNNGNGNGNNNNNGNGNNNNNNNGNGNGLTPVSWPILDNMHFFGAYPSVNIQKTGRTSIGFAWRQSTVQGFPSDALTSHLVPLGIVIL